MNILHVAHGYPPSVGGCQWLIKNLSDRLVAWYGDRVTVFTTTAYNMELFWQPRERALPEGVQNMDGVIVRRFPVFNRLGPLLMLLAHGSHRLGLPYNDRLRTLYNGPLIRGMASEIARSGADIVMATAFPHLQMYDALAGARRAHIPIVFLGAIHVADTWGYDRPMMYRAIAHCDAYIALTSFERDHLIQKGISASKVHVIGAGIDTAPFAAADGTPARQHFGWQDDPVVILVAKQSPRKQIDVLIEAMEQVWDTHPRARLVIAGARTAYSRQLREMIDALSPARHARVTVIDDFAEEVKPSLLAACDVFVLPSGHESFGIAFLEAWACGKPVVGARIGAIPAVIDEGRDGLLAAYQDPWELAGAIVALLSDPQRAARMGELGRQKVLAHYTWETIIARVHDLYETLTFR